MAESYIQLPADGKGKKTRTNTITGINGIVHQQIIQQSDTAGNIVNPAKEDGNLSYLVGMKIPKHDYIEMSYTTGNLTSVKYRDGGSSGTIVATLTLTYDTDGNLINVSKI